MKRAFTRATWVLSLTALAAASQTAYAHVNTQGAAFHNWNAKEDVDIDYVGQGVRNLSTVAARSVIASVSVVRTNAGSSTFTIDGKNALNTTTSFTLAAYTAGVLRSSVSFVTGPGAGQVGFYTTDQTLTGLDQFTRVSCFASLPPNSASVIYGVTQQQ